MKRWKLKRVDRLKAAPEFIAGYTGTSLVRGYVRWFRVDRACAIRELTEAGIVVPESEAASIQPAAKAARAEARRRKAACEGIVPEWDDRFAFIAGYTSGGAPFGTTREEMESLWEVEPADYDPFAPTRESDDPPPLKTSHRLSGQIAAGETDIKRNPVTRLDDDRYAECVEEATVDAYDESEQVSGWFTMIDENLAVPFKTVILGVKATVVKIDITHDDRIVAVVSRGDSSLTLSILDLPLPNRLPEGAELIIAYRRWASEHT